MKATVFKVQNIAKMALFSLLFLVVGCNSSEDSELSIFGYQSKPAWKVSQDYDMSSSMTMIVKVEQGTKGKISEPFVPKWTIEK